MSKREVKNLEILKPLVIHGDAPKEDERSERRVVRFLNASNDNIVEKGKQKKRDLKKFKEEATKMAFKDSWNWLLEKRRLKMVVDDRVVADAPLEDLTEDRERIESYGVYSGYHYQVLDPEYKDNPAKLCKIDPAISWGEMGLEVHVKNLVRGATPSIQKEGEESSSEGDSEEEDTYRGINNDHEKTEFTYKGVFAPKD